MVTKEFTHIGIEKKTQRQIALLATVRGGRIYQMVGAWAEEAWKQAKAEGLVMDAMIKNAADKSTTIKKGVKA